MARNSVNRALAIYLGRRKRRRFVTVFSTKHHSCGTRPACCWQQRTRLSTTKSDDRIADGDVWLRKAGLWYSAIRFDLSNRAIQVYELRLTGSEMRFPEAATGVCPQSLHC